LLNTNHAVSSFQDGSHIKGLIINFFRCFWPKLLQPPVDVPPEVFKNELPFLASFVTPLLKATKKVKKKNETMAFYSMAEYNAWQSELAPDTLKGWTIKYYKGLGTSTPTEAKEYFTAFVNNLRPFRWKSDTDGDMLDMVFDKKLASDRKKWIINNYDMAASVVVDPNEGNAVSYEDFVNKEMIHFSHADNIRSIPSVIDGLKPSQRKVLYACFKRNLKSEIKVAQLSGYWSVTHACDFLRMIHMPLTILLLCRFTRRQRRTYSLSSWRSIAPGDE
jgi:DNA topoisomerase II